MANLHITAAWDLTAHEPLTDLQSPLQNLFDQTFSVIPVMRPQDLDDVYKLRYEVYCLERGFESPDKFYQNQEVDMYDARSVYTLLQHKKSGEFLGTARLILPDREHMNDASFDHFPAQKLSNHSMVRDEDIFPLDSTAEISRICYSQKKARDLSLSPIEQKLILPGLLSGVYMLRDLHNVDHFMAVLEGRLSNKCRQLGFSPSEVGDEIEHKGIRYAVAYDCVKSADVVREKNMDLWNIITANGKFSKSTHAMTVEAMSPQWCADEIRISLPD